MIKFKTVKWKNMLSTGNQWTEVQLDRSKTTLIVGENGAGKTTLLDALMFAVYGTPYRDIKKAQLINSLTKGGLEVIVDFESEGSLYSIRRGMKPNIFEVLKNGQLLPQDAKTADYQLALENDIMKMNTKTFKQVVVLGAKGFIPFMELKQDPRRQVVEDIIDLQIYSTMNALLRGEMEENAANLRDVIASVSSLKGQLGLLDTQISSKHIDNAHLLAEFDSRKEQLDTQIEALTVEVARLRVRQTEIDQEITDHQAVLTKLQSLNEIERGLADKLSVFRRDISFLEGNESCPTCNQPIDVHFKDNTIQGYSEQADKLSTALTSINERQQAVADRLQEISTAVNTKTSLSQDITFKQHQISVNQQSISDIDDQITTLQQRSNHSALEEYASQLGRALVNETKIQRELMRNKEIQEYGGALLKDSGIKARIVKVYIPVINQLINKYLAAMNFFITFELDENFSETIKTPNMDDYSFQSFSEGEKMRINLAILFAWRDIARMRNSVSTNLLIMDEVFDGSLDTPGVEDFIDVIEEITGDTNIFIISHKSQMFDKFRSVIKFEKVRNFSRIVPEDQLT